MENHVKSESAGITGDDWIIVTILTVFAVYFYTCMEWLFFVTKPSFMSTLGFLETMQVMWVTPLPVAVAGMIGVMAFLIPTR
jgi:hypothetical protein